MEIIIKHEVETKLNIDFPYYSKNTVYAYKVINEKETLKIGTHWPSIEFNDYGISTQPFQSDASQITETEFKELYQIALTKLNEKL